MNQKKLHKKVDFDVALSFAGEDREYVENVALILKDMGFRVFYDKYETVSLWGKNLYPHLQEIYFKRAMFVVMFISKYYKKKLWSNHERESAQARAFTEKGEYILPVRFDRTQIPGILPTTGYINLTKYKPEDLAFLIKKKIGQVPRTHFFPREPDRLYKILKVRKSAEKKVVSSLAYWLYDKTLKLMTFQERFVLFKASINACPNGIPDNVHLELRYLSRLTGLNTNKLIAMFSRLDCLDINSLLYESEDHDSQSLAKPEQMIEIKFEPSLVSGVNNETGIMLALFEVVGSSLCPECAKQALKHLDFSVLGTLTSFDEKHSF